jgi:two-component system sensor histidine kinase ChvG
VPIDLTQVVGEATLNFREIMASRDVRLIRRLDESVIVRAGKGMLEIVLQSVLENATSFSPRGSTIVLTLTEHADSVELQIEDEGPGIDPRRLEHIFERYYSTRSPEGSNKKSAHAGLGLWIVRRNVEALGGKVAAVNRLGGGLCVTIALPKNGDK